jgi:hypothetical protein
VWVQQQLLEPGTVVPYEAGPEVVIGLTGYGKNMGIASTLEKIGPRVFILLLRGKMCEFRPNVWQMKEQVIAALAQVHKPV